MRESDDYHKGKTLMEQHAFKRLEKVEDDKRKAYKKKTKRISMQQIVMAIIFLFILGTMMMSLFH